MGRIAMLHKSGGLYDGSLQSCATRLPWSRASPEEASDPVCKVP